MNRSNTIIILLVIILLVLAGYYFFYQPTTVDTISTTTPPPTPQNSNAVDLSKNLENITFNLNGTITVVDNKNLTAKLTVIKNGITSYIYPILLTDDKTEFTLDGRASTISALKVGSNITVETKVYPYDKNQFRVDKIDILQ